MVKLGMYVLIFVIVIYKCVLYSSMPTRCEAPTDNCSCLPRLQHLHKNFGPASFERTTADHAGWWRRQYTHC